MSAEQIYIPGHTGLVESAAARRFGADGEYRVAMATHRGLELQDADATQFRFDSNSSGYVIPAAGTVGGILENKTYPADFPNANLAIQLNLLAAAHRVGVRKPIPGAVS